MGDVRNRPSIPLLKAAEFLVENFQERQNDENLLNTVAKEGVGSTVFLMDLEDACQTGEGEAMDKEAAKMYWASQKSTAVMDCLMELALQNFDTFGTLSYHLQRAYTFSGEKDHLWAFTRAMVSELKKQSLPEPHEKADVEIDSFIIPVLSTPDPDLWTKYAAALRLWEGDYVRSIGLRREISHWLSGLSLSYGEAKLDQLEVVKNDNLRDIPDFVLLAESLINKKSWEQKITALEALRFLMRKVKKDYTFLISDAVQFIRRTG